MCVSVCVCVFMYVVCVCMWYVCVCGMCVHVSMCLCVVCVVCMHVLDMFVYLHTQVTFGELSKSVSSMWSGASQQEKVVRYLH